MILKIHKNAYKTINYNFLNQVFKTSLNIISKNNLHKPWCENTKLIVNLIIIGDEEIKDLNKKWRNKNTVTDVLSFPYFSITRIDDLDDLNAIFPQVFGEIYLSFPQCSLQAQHLNHSIQKEMQILLIHSILHLFGYDHINDYQFAEMLALEKKIIENLEKDLSKK